VVNEAGINRIRLEVRSGAENDTDFWSLWQAGAISNTRWRQVRYATVNDNPDPNTINLAGFHFSELDDVVTRIVEPIRQRVASRGEALQVTLTYVAFTGQITDGSYHHGDPAEYAEFILAAFQHLQNRFGLVPDALEILLEPDNVAQWNEDVMGRAIIAVTDRLAAAGFNPRIVAPSTTKMSHAPQFIDRWAASGGILDRVDELSYHRYRGFSDSDLRRVAQTAAAHNLETSMLEWWDSGNSYKILHQDLKIGMNSTWQHGVVGGDANGPGEMKMYQIDDRNPAKPIITIDDKTKFTRQYFLFVRTGARRIGATSSSSSLDPLAFRNVDGGFVVVLKADASQSFTIAGLPAATYGLKYATQTEWDVDLPDQTVAAGQTVAASIPGEGVITIYRK